MAIVYSVVVIIVILELHRVVSDGVCADSVYELESSLKGNPFNIESIDNAFHPPNTHQPLWVDVLYYYNTTDQLLPLHPASYQARNNSITPNYHFRWVITPLFLPLGPEAIELLSGALISLESVTLYIVVQPVCGEDEQHHRDLLNKLTRKLTSYTSYEVGSLPEGYAVYVSPDEEQTILSHSYEYQEDVKMTHSLRVLLMITMFAVYVCFAVGIGFSLPLLLAKLGLFSQPQQQLLRDGTQPKVAMYWGAMLASFIFLIVLSIIQIRITVAMVKLSVVTIIFLPMPIHFIGFILFNVQRSRKIIHLRGRPHEKNEFEKCCFSFTTAMHMFASVVITLFLQLLSFHLGWLLMMLVTFPIQVGAMLVNVTMLYLSFSLLLGAWFQKCMSCGSAGKVRADSMMGISWISFGVFMLLTIYYLMISYAGVRYSDGVSAMMPSLMPIILYAALTTLGNKFTLRLPGLDTEKRLYDIKLQQRVSGISQYYHKDVKELPV